MIHMERSAIQIGDESIMFGTHPHPQRVMSCVVVVRCCHRHACSGYFEQVIYDPPLNIPRLPQIKVNREGGVARGAGDDVGVQAPSGQPVQATVQVVQVQETPAGNAPFWYRLWPQHRSPLSVRMPCSHRNSLLHLAHLLRARLQSQMWEGEHRR